MKDPVAVTKIAVCIDGGEIRARVIAAITRQGLPTIAGSNSVEELIAHRADDGALACVILAARRPDQDVAKSVAVIRSELPSTPVVVVCTRAGAGDVRRALSSGVDGVVVECEIDEALAPVVAAVRTGHSCVPSRNRSELPIQVLTTREKQILALVANELTNSQIAARLFLAESTVKSHLSSAFAKLNVSSRHEAASLVHDRDRGRAVGLPTVAEFRIAGAV